MMNYSAVGVMLIALGMLMVESSHGQTNSDCPDVMCSIYCEYGYKQDPVSGCDICECNQVTQIKEGQCPTVDGDQDGICEDACEHDGSCQEANQKCCSNGCGHACMDIVRDGYCPVPSSIDLTGNPGICANMCNDSSCTNNTHKCCQNDCGGSICVAPDTEKRGVCPVGMLSEGQLGSCAELCGRDSDCSVLQKCCSNGCGHVCITPRDLLAVHSGSCPVKPPQAGTCAELCMNDDECEMDEKCCQNACGAYSCVSAEDVPVRCPDVMCLVWCAYGFKKSNDGCDICECVAEPTEIHEGECPVEAPGDMGICSEDCSHDGNCDDNQKCCSNGCGHICVASIIPEPEGCPINAFPEGELGTCVQACTVMTVDRDCATEELCCSNGCGRVCTKRVTVHQVGTCPTGEIQLGWSGVCVEMCDNDGQCASNQKCCSNGCGHACTTVVSPPESCPDVVCQIFCEYGNKKDNNGCILCQCNEAGEAGVEKPGECPIGFLPEGFIGTCAEECENDDGCADRQKCCSNGCGHVCIDALNVEPVCPAVLCARYCENGLTKDDNGCEVCSCNDEQKCDSIKCRMHCPYGYKEDKYGCNICQCEDRPTKCPGVMCEIFCLFGYQRDENGCEVCSCTPEASALNVKSGTCPAAQLDADPPASCADLCDNDEECLNKGEKCCFNGCGSQCMATGGSGKGTVPVSPIALLVATIISMLASSSRL